MFIVGVFAFTVNDSVASSYFNMFILNRSGGVGTLSATGSSVIPSVPVISTSTKELFRSSNYDIRSNAYGKSTEEIINYLNKIGINISTNGFSTSTPKVLISSLSKSEASPGSLISILGKGFDRNSNTVYFNDEAVKNLSSSIGTAIAVRVPANVYGNVSVRVESNKEKSNFYPLVVKKFGTIAPKISVSQSQVRLNTKIVIRGSNIARINTIHTTLGSVSNIESSGKGFVEFSVSNLPGFKVYNNVSKENVSSTTMMVWISNENGISNVVGPISITLAQ